MGSLLFDLFLVSCNSLGNLDPNLCDQQHEKCNRQKEDTWDKNGGDASFYIRIMVVSHIIEIKGCRRWIEPE